MTDPQFTPRWRHWAPRVAIAIIIPFLLVGIIELSLRAFGVGFPTSVMTPCTIQGRSASCYNLFFAAPFFPPGMIKAPQVYAIPDEKPKNTYRIVVLGESAAMGDPDPAYGFSRYLEVMLRERYPAMNFEVSNTGIVAINSHVSLRIAKELAKHQPDLFIIYSGNNEVVGPYGPGTALTGSSMSLPLIRSSIFVRSTRIGQLLTKLVTRKREWGGMEMFLDKQIRGDSPLMEQAYRNFDANLRDTITAAHRSGARVIVSTVATNLRDCAPFGSLHREGLGQDDLRKWTALVQEGASLEEGRAYEEALKRYSAATAIDNQYAELEYRMARCFWMLRDYRSAKGHFSRARDLDTLRFRADSRINDINRSAASSAAGTELVDSDAVLAKENPDGIIGSEMVYEHVHLTPEGNYLMARAMFRQIISKMDAGTGHLAEDVYVPSQEKCDQLLALTDHDRSRLAAEMLQRLEKAPFTKQLNHADEVSRLILKAGASVETPEETVTKYQWAIAQRPDDRILHYKFGLFLFDYNPAAGAEQLRMAQPWDGFPVFTPDGRQIE
jgi:tetratricopeptide (TPR) repeat protein